MRIPLPNLLRLALILVGLATSPAAVFGEEAAADARRDHDLARRGQALQATIPLRDILASVRKESLGQIAGIELEHENGAWLYEIKVISPKGVMMTVHVDARTGAFVPGREK